jgi:hypothetical protein
MSHQFVYPKVTEFRPPPDGRARGAPRDLPWRSQRALVEASLLRRPDIRVTPARASR